MICRTSRVQDSTRIFALINSNLDDYFSEDVIEFFLMQWPNGQLIAEDLFGNIFGAICGSRLENGAAAISLFAVDASHRRSGIGSKLLEDFRTRCFMEGFSMIQLEVRTTNENAIRFYRNHGFSVSETLYNFYSNGGDAYRMVLVLSKVSNASS